MECYFVKGSAASKWNAHISLKKLKSKWFEVGTQAKYPLTGLHFIRLPITKLQRCAIGSDVLVW